MAGLWEDILEVLNQSGAVPDALQMIPLGGKAACRAANSTALRAHHQAAGAKGVTPQQSFGRLRASDGKTVHWPVFWAISHFTTKIHLRVNAHGLPMRTEITTGQTSDCLGFDLMMADNLPEPKVLLADRGYDADCIRKTMPERDILPPIPMRKMRVGVDHGLYRLRNMVNDASTR